MKEFIKYDQMITYVCMQYTTSILNVSKWGVALLNPWLLWVVRKLLLVQRNGASVDLLHASSLNVYPQVEHSAYS